ncbi:MAG: spermidine synthase [Burkholderiales bacterium]
MTHLARIAGRLTVMLACMLQITAAGAAGPVLHEQASPFGPIVVTDEGDGLRALRFGRDGVRQSLVRPDDPEYLGLPYITAMLAGLALSAGQQRFLVIGLGGGTLPAFLRKKFPDADIDAVDINPEVVAVAKTWLGFREDARMRIHVADGRKFIESVQQPYDVILLDAFGADAVPAHLTTAEFLAAVRRAVRDDGIVISNVWRTASNPPYASMVQTYLNGFGGLHVLRVASTNNRILLALPRVQTLTRQGFAALAGRLSTDRSFRFNAAPLVERGWTPADNEAHGGAVLTDAAISR